MDDYTLIIIVVIIVALADVINTWINRRKK